MIETLSRFLRKALTTSTVLAALKLVWQAAPVWTTVQAVLLILQGILPLLSLYTTKLIIDTLSLSLSNDFLGQTDRQSQLILLVIALGIILILSSFINVLINFTNTLQSQKFSNYMFGILHAKSIAIDLACYENAEYHDTYERAQKEATYRPNQLLRHLVVLVQNSLTFFIMGGLLLTLHWGIGIVVMIAAIPTFWVRILHADERYRWQRRRTALERQGDYLSGMMIHESFAKEIRLFGLGQLFSRRFDHVRKQLYQELLAISRRFLLTNLFAQTIATVLTITVYGYVVLRTYQGQLTIGDVVLYYQGLQRGQQAFRAMTNTLSSLYEDKLFLDNLYEFLNLKPAIASPAHPKPVPSAMQQGICFEQVDFKYPGTERQALKAISLQIKPREVIALVGENGSGKTTLIKLLCRLYEPTAGSITLDGIDLREFDLDDLRQQISVIFQDYIKYFLPAKENIWLGNVSIDPDIKVIQKAAIRSGADAVIQQLPQQYDTVLGKLFAGGEELSIGQWQKVALARAFLRDSQLIVLDEPTSAMDPQAEHEVFQRFRELIQQQSAILISHRLSTVRMADRIYFMSQGSILEVGTHAELMDKQGHYARLFEIQAQKYR
ncbi:MAG: ABC transporter ATP-binding protein [Cyanobacteria bacterium P01_H01_bin.58]